MARIMKAKYYRGMDSWLSAVVKPNASFVWRSILASQALIKSMVRCRIGNGITTSIWNSPWLPDSSNPMVTTALSPGLTFSTVNDLLDPVSGSWKTDSLMNHFNTRDVNLMQSIIPSPNVEDTWYCPDDLNGHYTVKMGYKKQCTLTDMPAHPQQFTHWSLLWKLNIPPKMRVFLWRAGRGVLPVRSNLRHRGVIIDTYCPSCQVTNETIFHALVGCPQVLEGWQAAGLAVMLRPEMDFLVWFEQIVDSSGKEEVERIASLTYHLWHARNKMVWEGEPINSLIAWRIASRVLFDWKSWGVRQRTDDIQATAGPMQGTFAFLGTGVRCTVDAAIFQEQGKAGFGAVVFDGDGRFVEAVNGPISYDLSPYQAEAVACREALSSLKSRNYEAIHLMSDCMNVVKAISGHSRDLSYTCPIVEQCRSLLKQFSFSKCYFLSRSANQAAHTLARATGSQSVRLFWDSIPPCCTNLGLL